MTRSVVAFAGGIVGGLTAMPGAPPGDLVRVARYSAWSGWKAIPA